jgi:hypothetical protein
MGVLVLPKRGVEDTEAIWQYQALGAPQILALQLDLAEVKRWKMMAHGAPQLIERIDPDQLHNAIVAHQDEWGPEQILRAKAIGFRASPVQLDFFDVGLVPTIESVVREKLHDLLRQVIARCQEAYLLRRDQEPNYQALFRLIFRLVAAKLLLDRQHPGGDWGNLDPRKVLNDVEAFYFRSSAAEKVLQDRYVQQIAWDQLRTAFDFSNVSVETLAYVYENTLVSTETRRLYDVHATPPELAEYVVRTLPFEELPQQERFVFEPFAGHAPFLTASLGRLRILLPADMTQQQRHAYFTRMLTGLEIDTFAREIASYSLMFADYPNSDGWRILNADTFTHPRFDTLLAQSRIVLCNPPYSDFSSAERRASNAIRSPNKAVEALRRILERPPQMLGFVLPRVFVNGQSYRGLRKKMASLYSEIQVVGVPQAAFRYSNIETVLLLACGVGPERSRLYTTQVGQDDYRSFVLTGKVTWHTEAPADYLERKPVPDFWYSPIHKILDELAYLPRLGDMAEVHRGIEYNVPFRKNAERLVSDEPREGFVPGLVNTREGFEPYQITSHRYLNMAPELMLYEAYLRPWDKPKVIANAGRIRADRWVIAGAVDRDRLVCYQRFHGIWPKDHLPVEVLAAVVNGPVANAFVSIHRTSRDNQVRIVQQIPVPSFTPQQIQAIVTLVQEYRACREQWIAGSYSHLGFEDRCRDLTLRVDAEILAAYDLAPRLERKLLDYFEGFSRPGPVAFDRYYPPDFRPSVPWRVFISEEFQNSTAVQTLARLPVLHDSAISEVVRDLSE